MIDIPLNGPVHAIDGDCGTATNFIVNPVSQEVTHIAIRDDTLVDNPTRLVPVTNVSDVVDGRITLGCTRENVANMPPFITRNLIQQSPSSSAHASSYASNYVFNDAAYSFVDQPNIPEGTRSVVSGMDVEATDGRVGTLDELVIDPEGGKITHIHMRDNHLWGKREITIPVAKIHSVVCNTVFLDLDKKAVKGLPSVKVKRQ